MAKSKGLIVSNAGLKLVSLALALLLEFYFYSQDNSTTQLVSAVLEIQNIPSNRLIIDPPYAEDGLPAHLEVSGPKSVINQISKGFHVVKIPFPEKAPFTFPIDIKYEDLQLPPSVKIVSAKPARLTVRTVELLRKEIPVEIPTEGELENGYDLVGIKVFPKTVIVRGPLQEVQKIEVSKVEPLNLTGLNKSTKLELRLKSAGEFSTLNVNLVSVEVVIEEKIVSKEIKDVQVIQNNGILSLGKKVKFSPSEVKIVLKGKASKIEKMDNSIKIIPLENLEKLPRRVKLKAEVEEGVIVEKIIPSEVHAKFVDN